MGVDLNVLIADDSGVMRKMIIRTLGQTEYKAAKIVEAVDGADGLVKLEENPDVNLILSDWNMPNMDGITFVTKAREQKPDIGIVMITTEGTMGKMEEAMDIVDNYVVKPFTAETLGNKLKKVVEKLG